MGLFSSIGGFLGIGGDSLFEGILGGLSGTSRGRSDRRMAEMQGQFALRNTREQGRESRRSTEFEALLGKWLKDKEKEERRMGLSNFARFSSQDYGEPSYVPPPVGAMPSTRDFDDAYYDKEGNRPINNQMSQVRPNQIRGGR